MEESEFFLEFKFISCLAATEFMKSLCGETLSSLSSHPLFSCIVTVCAMVLLYFPRFFWKIVLSPVLILSGILLFTILRLSAIQKSQDEQKEKNLSIPEPIISEENRESKEDKERSSAEPEEMNSLEQVRDWITDHRKIKSESEMGLSLNSCFEESFSEWNVKAPLEVKYEENRASKEEENANNSTVPEETYSVEQVHQWITGHRKMNFDSEKGFSSISCFEESFLEWNVKAPLEVIYEEHECEEEGEEDPNQETDTRFGILGYPPLSRCYLESDSESLSDGGFPPKGSWDSPENICFERDEEDREELIEIAIEWGCKTRGLEFQFDEDNLIEIDISPTRYREFSDDNELLSGDISCSS